jgi:hypothetical protein
MGGYLRPERSTPSATLSLKPASRRRKLSRRRRIRVSLRRKSQDNEFFYGQKR